MNRLPGTAALASRILGGDIYDALRRRDRVATVRAPVAGKSPRRAARRIFPRYELQFGRVAGYLSVYKKAIYMRIGIAVFAAATLGVAAAATSIAVLSRNVVVGLSGRQPDCHPQRDLRERANLMLKMDLA